MTATTDRTDTAEGDATAAPAPELDTDAPEAQERQDDRDQPEAVRDARREAASYRRRLREAEGLRNDAQAERDRLAGIVESFQRTAVESLAEAGPRALASGADLWAAGTDLAALLDDEGRPDAARVAEAVDQALQRRPHWRKSHGVADGGARGSTPEPSTSWSGVLGGAEGRR